MNLVTTRQTLATALEAAGRVVYAFPREQIVAPALVVVPGSPYVEVWTKNGYHIRFTLTAVVDLADNQTALANLETLMFDVLAALPSGFNGVTWGTPTVTEVSGRQMLTSEITIECAVNAA